jgi:hypothetical protein
MNNYETKIKYPAISPISDGGPGLRKDLLISTAILLVLVFTTIFALGDASAEDGPAYQRIYGTVTEISTMRAAGEPVPGAEVYIEQEPNEEPMAFTNQSKTDSEGNFEIWQVPGQYRIWVKAQGYSKTWNVFTVPDEKGVRLDIELVPGSDTYSPEFKTEKLERSLEAGSSAVVKFQIENGGDTVDSYNVSINGDRMDWPSMGKVRSTSGGGPYSQSVSNLEDNGIADIEINITVPDDAAPGNYTFTLRTRSLWEPSKKADIPLVITVKGSSTGPVDDEIEVEDEETPFLGLSILLTALVISNLMITRKRGF